MKERKRKLNLYFTIHYSFILLMVGSFFTGQTILLLMYFVCLVFHEGFHAFVASKLGYKIGKIKLLATGAVLEAESDEFSYSDEIRIALSGPLFNLCMAILLVMSWWIVPESYNYTLDLCVINLAIFCFNMLPIFPLDGGRILLAVISKKTERKQAVVISKSITIILAVLIFLVFIFSLFSYPNFSLGIMAVTLFISAITEDKSAVYKKAFYKSRKIDRSAKRGVEIKFLCVQNDMDKSKMLKLITPRFYTIFVLVNNQMKITKYLSEDELINSLSSIN